jgi:hypothetical protein
MSDSNSLYGYTTATGEKMVLLNWWETGFVDVEDLTVGAICDERFVVINGNRGMKIDVHILHPVPRGEQPGTEKIFLTIGGLWISDDIREAVIDFNRENQDYLIEIMDYVGHGGDWDAGLSRFQVDIITGRGPDIIIDWGANIRFQDIMLDIYPFIDADPELSREDFFQSILSAMESSDGGLHRIPTGFSITTMIGLAERFGHIESWTLSELHSQVIDAADLHFPLGVLMNGNMFILTMLHGSDLIDWDSYTANLNSEAFINIIEIAKLLPKEQDFDASLTHPLVLLLRGDHLLVDIIFGDFQSFQGFAEILKDDFLIMGLPTEHGGVNTVIGHNPMGINKASKNPAGAWEFLRRFLLPVEELNFDENSGSTFDGQPFPVRIDMFDAFIAYYQTPLYFTDSDGNPVYDEDGNRLERFHSTYYLRSFNNGIVEMDGYPLYTMSDDIAIKLRSFIESAKPGGGRFNREIIDIISGDLEAFFNDVRTAEDTARIIQNRVQNYMNEQKLLS